MVSDERYEPIRIKSKRKKPISVDEWEGGEEDRKFRYSKNVIVSPIASFYGYCNDEELDSFILSKKKCYNKQSMHEHTTKYINYFIKHYDKNNELLSVYYKLKPLIDHEPLYTKENFLYDIQTYILTQSMLHKVSLMVEDNYDLNLNYKNTINPSLQYTNRHAKILMAVSIVMNILIPLTTHYIYIHNLDANEFLLEVFDKVLELSDVDLYSKLYDTSVTNIMKSRRGNKLWDKQDIRGNNFTTHSEYCVENMILNIIPKYEFNQNIISFNFTSIKKNMGYKITDISYEFNFKSFSSSERDEDYNSEFDKFESYQITQNEGILLQNNVNSIYTMKQIDYLYGPFSDEEISFYHKSLSKDGANPMNDFQKILISNLFFKYFGEPVSFKSINILDYIKLMIAGRRLLIANNMVILPYIFSSKVANIQNRKNVNKKESIKLTASPYFEQVMLKYQSTRMREFIMSVIATILSSEFTIIDFEDETLHGRTIDVIPDIIFEELLMYILIT